MISYRLRGLLNLHAGATVLMAALLLLAYQNCFRYIYSVELNPGVRIMPFVFCVVAGMVLGAHYVQVMASRFHLLSWVDSARISTRQVGIVALFIFAFMFGFKEREMSRMFIISYLLLMWLMLLVVNVALPKILCRLFFAKRRRIPTLFVGGPKSLEKLRHWLAAKEMLGLHPVGFVSEQEHPHLGSATPFLGTLRDLPRTIAQRLVVQVIVLEMPRTKDDSQYIIESCQDQGCRLLFYSNLAEQLQHPVVTTTEEGYQFYTLQEEPLEDPLNRIIKRVLDLVIAVPIVFLVLPPLTLVVWLMQSLQAPGPLFFVQERTGHGQQKFKIIKFRSMYVRGAHGEDDTKQAERGDRRVYRFGQFLRSTSVDEFPQFINVLTGEMSIVGPRPHLVAHDHLFNAMTKGYRTRFFVKPGITGLAQCHGLRGEITDSKLLERRIKLDVDYIAQWSFWLDINLMLKTVWQVLFPPRTAY
jgi:exopolysaccharide biosynthesis polyprenyl glycosylphosphotransferase